MKPGEPLVVGDMLDGRYRIHKVLGQGGMGRVYLANDSRLANRPVAAKEMILGDGVQEKKAIEDFSREASVLANLSHPGIPQVIDYFAERGRHYLVMEYVAGGDLQRHLDELGPKGRFPEAKVLRWARQILEVLQFLHVQKPPIVYRDLKPGNIMIDHHGRAMLIDFGIARFLPPSGRGTQIGSIGYAPPEQYLGKMEPRSDLYALAATMHHLLTGRDPQLEPPFSFPQLRSLAPEVSAQTERVVMSALAKEIDKRPQSAREMLDALANPGPEEASSETDAHRSRNLPQSAAPGIGTMATIVLNRPMPETNSPNPGAVKGAPGTGIGEKANNSAARAKTPRILAKPRGDEAKAASASTKTQDLGLKGKSAGSAASAAKPAGSGRSAREVATPSRVAAALSSIRARMATNFAPSAALQKARKTNESGSSRADTSEKSSLGVDRPAIVNKPLIANEPAATPALRNGYATNTAAGQMDGGAWLVAASEGKQFAVIGARTVIGRIEGPVDGVDINLVGLKRGMDRVSRRHAEIIKQGTDYFIRDLGSLNGTYIGGRGRLGRDQLYKLRDRDEVVLGGAKLEFRKG
jgi:serine/threonine protein kinase